MLEAHLKIEVVLFCGLNDLVPFFGDCQIDLAFFEGSRAGRPIEIFAVPMIHPDSRPVLTGVVHFCEHLRNFREILGLPSLIVPEGEEVSPAIENESRVIRPVDPNETGSRVPADIPVLLFKLLLVRDLPVELHGGDRVLPGSVRREAHPPGGSSRRKNRERRSWRRPAVSG